MRNADRTGLLAIVNPTAGTGARPDGAHQRTQQLRAFGEAVGQAVDVRVTERAGHARALALDAVGRGVSRVVAWGGDGTVNEVASSLAFTDVALAVIPGGSGNGLARDLGIPLDPSQAFRAACSGRLRRIDAGELGGRLFFNVAGVGLDAQVAARFAAIGSRRRGLWRYVRAAAVEILRYRADDVAIVTSSGTRAVRPLMVAFANTRQYGNGALIAPQAKPDDGLLDMVIVGDRPLWRLVAGVPALFSGRIAEQPGVFLERVTAVDLEGTRLVSGHVDGEPCEPAARVVVRVRPGALSVVVPGTA